MAGAESGVDWSQGLKRTDQDEGSTPSCSIGAKPKEKTMKIKTIPWEKEGNESERRK